MSPAAGLDLLHDVAERIVIAHLLRSGAVRAEKVVDRVSIHGRDVDLVVIDARESRRVKLKADPYFGIDQRKVADRTLSFYRGETGSFAFEAVANSATREPGWAIASDAQDLYYYYLALAQSPEEISALMDERDEVFFSELQVERDELVVLPLAEVRAWFEGHADAYASRPVMFAGAAAWYRLVPRADVEGAVATVRRVGQIFDALAR
jgi:hypothetical protein